MIAIPADVRATRASEILSVLRDLDEDGALVVCYRIPAWTPLGRALRSWRAKGRVGPAGARCVDALLDNPRLYGVEPGCDAPIDALVFPAVSP